MRDRITRRIQIIMCFLILIPVVFLTGCDGSNVTHTPKIDRDLNKLSLTELWDIISESTDIQEQGAEMGSFYLHVDAGSKIDSLYFTFYGWNKDGESCSYTADISSDDRINIRVHETSSFMMSWHPSKVFIEIDKLGLDSLEPGDEGLAFHIDFQYGDIGYSRNYMELYSLENGYLLPLDEIIFHSQFPWCTISIYKLYPVDTPTSTVATPVSPEERTSQIWFCSDDINMAEIVEYLEVPE